MNPSDLNFPLRTGRSVHGETQPIDWNNVQTIMALMCVFNSQAFEDGVKYAKAAGRDVVLAEDYVLGLKFNAVPSTRFYSKENLHEKVAEWRANDQLGNLVHMAMGGVDQYPSEEDSEEEESSEEEEGGEEFEEEEIWTRGPETNDLVRKMHAAEEEYTNWNPPTEQFEAVAVKRAIDRALLSLEFP